MSTRDDRETVVRMGDKSEPVWIWTCQKTVANRLRRKGHEALRVSMGADGREVGWWFELHFRDVKLRVLRAAAFGADEEARHDGRFPPKTGP